MTCRSILCPVDFSVQSRGALRYAIAVARRSGGRLTVMFVNDPLLLAAVRIQYGGEREFVDRTRAELARFVSRSIPTSPIEQKNIAFEVPVGNPADEILRAARRRRSDLVVMGTHGLSGVQKLFFGSTTEQVLRRATVPVLATPPSIGRRRPSTVPLTITRVVAPLDLAGEWRSDVTRAAAIAAAFDAELHLVHVLARVQTPPWLRSTGGAAQRRRIDRATRALERVRTTLFADLRSTSTVLTGNPAHEIARLTSRAGSLVVMSLRGTTGVWGARRGSIAYHVVTHSATPVLALPRRGLGGVSVRAKKAITRALSARDRIEIAGIDALLSMGSPRRPFKP
jgi:nucleotide-binding universal stress UspA family protein